MPREEPPDLERFNGENFLCDQCEFRTPVWKSFRNRNPHLVLYIFIVMRIFLSNGGSKGGRGRGECTVFFVWIRFHTIENGDKGWTY